MKAFLIRLYSLFQNFGFDLIAFTNLRFLPRYLGNLITWKRQGGKVNSIFPILNDFNDFSGNASGEYFHQDLLVATYIFKSKPRRHIDVASRVDGFVAHVASFREIEVIDVRPLKSSHQNIKYTQHDFMKPLNDERTDSLSCLHSLEHFGLGRYSDPIDIFGFEKGITNLISLLEPGGYLYISFPIGLKNHVSFNAQRTLHPKYVLQLEDVKEKLNLVNFDYVDYSGDLILNSSIDEFLDNSTSGLGIYTFCRTN